MRASPRALVNLTCRRAKTGKGDYKRSRLADSRSLLGAIRR